MGNSIGGFRSTRLEEAAARGRDKIRPLRVQLENTFDIGKTEARRAYLERRGFSSEDAQKLAKTAEGNQRAFNWFFSPPIGLIAGYLLGSDFSEIQPGSERMLVPILSFGAIGVAAFVYVRSSYFSIVRITKHCLDAARLLSESYTNQRQIQFRSIGYRVRDVRRKKRELQKCASVIRANNRSLASARGKIEEQSISDIPRLLQWSAQNFPQGRSRDHAVEACLTQLKHLIPRKDYFPLRVPLPPDAPGMIERAHFRWARSTVQASQTPLAVAIVTTVGSAFLIHFWR